MRTPAGIECPYFYGNYFRGRKNEECRLIGEQRPPNNWTPDLCKTCPVPAITRANACPNMILSGKVEKKMLGLSRRVHVTASCKLVQGAVQVPEIGCGHCHEFPEIVVDKNE
jgi:hypothetical protein